MHFKAATGKQLAFAPGEIFKEVKIGIINKDNSFEGNRTFQVIFSSPHSSVILKGPKQVNVTIMYTKGNAKLVGVVILIRKRFCNSFFINCWRTVNLSGVFENEVLEEP